MPSSSDKNTHQSPVIVWFRDDLRTRDHPALNAAAQTGRPVLAVFILDEVTEGIRINGAAQKWFQHHALEGLSGALTAMGGRLDIFTGNSKDVIGQLAEETGACSVCWNRRCGETELEIDSALKSGLVEKGIEVKSFAGNLLHEPYRLKTGSGGPYRVYSPFWRAMTEQREPRTALPAPKKLTPGEKPDNTVVLADLGLLPKNPDWAAGWEDIWVANEQGASETLSDFLDEGIDGYKDGRDFPARHHASRLSPYLRFGLISPFQVWHAARHREDAGKANSRDVEKFLKEVAWREFSYHLLFHFPYLPWKNHQEKFDAFPWKQASRDETTANQFDAWKKGQTGYPIVDAGMRELWQTGYMHNRVRMIVASFLVKHLLIHWREGESWFWDTLVDGDPANNAASWQWVAGCGADAAPYFRVFNPILQGRKFDTKGEYVRRFVPELAGLPDKYLHSPWEAPEETLEQSGIRLGETYPRPIIEHERGRERALEAFQELKKAD